MKTKSTRKPQTHAPKPNPDAPIPLRPVDPALRSPGEMLVSSGVIEKARDAKDEVERAIVELALQVQPDLDQFESVHAERCREALVSAWNGLDDVLRWLKAARAMWAPEAPKAAAS